jgi:hypothetical protein
MRSAVAFIALRVALSELSFLSFTNRIRIILIRKPVLMARAKSMGAVMIRIVLDCP